MAAYKLLICVALMAIVGRGQSQVISSGCCPSDIKVISNFDVSKYLGTWFEYAKYPASFQNGVCVTAEYSLLTDGNVGVKNTQVDVKTGVANSIIGTASLVSDGKLLVIFPVAPTVEVSSNYWVLDTDYTSYSVVYSCQDLPNNQHSTFVWILTRERSPTSQTINCATNVLKRNNISLDPLVLTTQAGCK